MRKMGLAAAMLLALLMLVGCGSSPKSEFIKLIKADVSRVHGATPEKTVKIEFTQFDEVDESKYYAKVHLTYDWGEKPYKYTYKQQATFVMKHYGGEYHLDGGGTYYSRNKVE